MAIGPRLTVDIREKRFAGVDAPLFRDLAFTVEAGSVVALVGPSGVGKSTLLRMIAGIDQAFDGDIRIGDVSAAAAPPAGLVFQDARLLPWLSAIGNITAVRAATGRAEALAWLDRVGLGGVGDALPDQLSGGMQRRVGLARALSVNPRFLLLDEPFVSLDRQLVREIGALFAALLTAEQSTAILVTHLAEDAAQLADRALVLAGRPARIVADRPLAIPRAARRPADVAMLAEWLERQAEEPVP